MSIRVMEMHKADSKTFTFKVMSGATPITDFEEVYFTIKNDCYTDVAKLQKKLNSGIVLNTTTNEYEVTILPEDTESWEYGRYAFDIEVKKGSLRQTLILGDFMIKPIVTFPSNED